MKNEIQSFENSPYNKRFQQLLKKRRDAYLGSIEAITNSIKRKMHTMMLTKEELLQQLNIILNQKTLDYNYISMEFAKIEKYQLFIDFIKTMSAWHYYLKFYSDEEDFEICAMIRDAIKIEMTDFNLNLIEFCPTYCDPSDNELINDIIEETKKTYNL